MKKKLSISLLIFGLFFIFSGETFAYDNKTTHPALTDEIVDFYNLSFPNQQLTSQQKEWVIEGSILEDTPPRWINHFYDPIYKTGWTGEEAGKISVSFVQFLSRFALSLEKPLSAVEWVKNSLIQQEYSRYGGNRTWKKALEYYADGNLEESYKTLGYVLHLLEDQSVPEHTRNDTHAQEVSGATGDEGSPYEQYTAIYNRSKIKELNIVNNLKQTNISPITKPAIEDYLISLAEYSNKFFFSKDTTDSSKYQNPKIIRDDGSFGYGIDENNKEFSLVIVDTKIKDNKIVKEYSIKNREEYYPILYAYFYRLSRQAVLHGAGAIDLFRKQADDAVVNKEYSIHLVNFDFSKFVIPVISLVGEGYKIWNTTTSFFAQIGSAVGNIVSTVGGFFSNLFGGDNQGFQPAGQISLGQPDVIQSTGQADLGAGQNQTGSDGEISGLLEDLKNKTPQSLKTEVDDVEPELTEDDEEVAEAAAESVQPADDQIIETENQVAIENQNEPARCSFNTSQQTSHQGIIINEVAWMGASNSANDEWIELKNISNGAVDINSWQIIDQGEQIKIQIGLINKTNLNPGEFILLERTDDDSVPNIAADLIYTGALSNTNEGLRLFNGQCNLIDEVLANSDWPAGDNSQNRTMERAADFSWHTYNGVAQNNILGTPKKENSKPTFATTGGSGGGSPTIAQQPTTDDQQQTAKILINEIKTYPTGERFIEFYNPSGSAINLTNWYIQRKTQSGSSFNSLVSKTYFENKIIGAYGYFLISHDSLAGADIILDNLTLTESNTIQIKNSSGEVVDKVGWGSSGDCEGDCAPEPLTSRSIQRKFQNNTFVDTDNNAADFEIQNCPSPKTLSLTCQSAQPNQSPSAFFVYAPQNPEVDQEIIFNAASSTDSDGNIVSYQWDFGDGENATSSQTTISHSYSSAGDYLASLIVFDDQNASSSATSNIVVSLPAAPVQPGIDHIVVSEIYPDRTGENKDFIEFYNPTDGEVNISDWSIQILSANATSTGKIKKKNFEDGNRISPKGFFLVGIDDYAGGTNADMSWSSGSLNSTDGATIFLIDNTEIITDVDDSNIVDRVAYGSGDGLILPEESSVVLPNEGQSLERGAWQNNVCVSAQNDGEFLGNGCDIDNNQNDFEIRQTPNPQNSQSLPETRSAPTAVQDFNLSYSASSVTINFSWSPSQDASGATSTIVYEIQEYNSPGIVIFNSSSTTQFNKNIGEVGRDYNFSIQAFDKEGLGSAIASSTISVPSFLEDIYFYKNPQTEDEFVELRYEQYPFLPNIYPYGADSWHSLILYFDQEPAGELILGNYGVPVNTDGILPIKYGTCGDEGSNAPHYNIFLRDDIVSESSKCYPAGGIIANTLHHNLLEDNNLILKAVVPEGIDIQESDYLTIAYYGRINTEPSNDFKLIAIDKTKYYFQNELPAHQPPAAPSDFQMEFDGINMLNVSFSSSIDLDTIDSLISYQSSEDGENWEPLEFIGGNDPNKKYVQASLDLGENYHRYFRSVDDFGLISELVEADWQYPSVTIQFSQDQNDSWSDIWGTKDSYWNCGLPPQSICPTSVSLQSFIPETDLSFDLAAVKLKQSGTGTTMEIVVLNNKTENNQDRPDFNNMAATSITKTVSNPNENSETIFSFNSSVSLIGGNRYWFVLNVNNYFQESSFYNDISKWQNALASGDVYAGGEAAKAKFGGSDFQILPDADWYLKLALSEE